MRTLTWLWAVLACVTPLVAEVGDLQSVAPGQGLAMFPPQTVMSPQGLATAAAGSGTASPKAYLATFAREGLTVNVALDAARKGSDKLEVFRLDFSGTGDFKAASVIPAKGTKDAFTAPPTLLTVQINGRKVNLLVSVSVYKPTKGATAVLTMGTAMKGTCTFGDKALPVCILDTSGNLSCHDADPWPYRGPGLGDTLIVAADNTFKSPLAQVKLGKRVCLQGQWYDVQVSDDLKITASPVKVETGMINIQMERWQGQLTSQFHDLTLAGSKKPISVPAGAYMVTELQELRPGKPADATATYAAGGKNIDVQAGQTAEVEIGSPIQASLSVNAAAGQVSFGLQATDRTGLRLVEITNNAGRRPPTPTIEIFDSTGKKIYSSGMEYG